MVKSMSTSTMADPPRCGVRPSPVAKKTRARSAVGACAFAVLPLLTPHAFGQPSAGSSIADLSLEELGNIRVTSVTGRPQATRDAAASLFVITAQDIRRSGAVSLPELLRLAPNLEVARINAGQYAISSRGFNNNIGNKLLVLVDGRTVYSSLFSGVFWDAQGLMSEDIERIEVISGPGSTLWGANAVNGVINVITRSALDTDGVLVSARAGGDGTRVSARAAGALSETAAYRVYAMRTENDATERQDGTAAGDQSRRERVGFRIDNRSGASRATLQGDAYRGGGDSAPSSASPRLSGANLLGRWSHQYPDGSNWQLQAYFDQERRDDGVAFRAAARTMDIEFNHVPATTGAHKLIWGFGHRQARSATTPTALVLFDPPVRQLRWSNVFVQDEYSVRPDLRLTAGLKLENNVYTGLEYLPTLRATYDLSSKSLVWASASRAVRAPARLDRDFFLPGSAPFLIAGGPDFRSEVANVLEVGHRAYFSKASYSVTLFRSHYDGLRAGRAAPTTIGNLAYGQVSGLEAWGSIEMSPAWRVSGRLLELRTSLKAAAEAASSSVPNLGNDPKHQWTIRSSSTLAPNVEFDAAIRHVSALPDPQVPSYTVADLRLGWRPSAAWELSLSLENAGARHVEYQGGSVFGRTVSLQLQWGLPR